MRSLFSQTAAAVTLAAASFSALSQDLPASGPAPASAPASDSSGCQLSARSVIGAFLASVTSVGGAKTGVQGAGRGSGDAVQRSISPECAKPARPNASSATP